MSDNDPTPLHLSLTERLARLFGPTVDPHISIAPQTMRAPTTEIVAGLLGGSGAEDRYELRREIDRGGMGIVYEVWDRDLRRPLAMKVALEDVEQDRPDDRRVARFLEEAQITAQLDHPGVVPVHELGVTGEGRVFFTMRQVRGRDLREVLHCVQFGLDDWSVARVLSVLLRVCEAVAFAHSRGVIHRDLKPANVMVGEFGEVYVMDWGLARVISGSGGSAPARATDETVSTVRHDARAASSDSPLVTLDGDVLGTPAYMAPEQARSELAELTPRADVYAIGAMLYELLAQEPPYFPTGRSTSPIEALHALRDGPPRSLDEVRDGLAPELVAICSKAMAYDPADRYPVVTALASDLRAFLERRVVTAYESGAWAEARQWVRRNRPLAGALAATVLALIVGFTVSASQYVRANDEALAAQESERNARNETAKVLRLSDTLRLADLEAEAQELWPATPELVPALLDWKRRADALLDNLGRHRETLAALRGRAAQPASSRERTWRFDDIEVQWQHDMLVGLVSGLERLSDPDVTRGALAGVTARLALIDELTQRTASAPDVAQLWDATRREIASSPRYAGLDLPPQFGLLPLGTDLDSGLAEFAHLASGEPPRRGPDGRLQLGAESGIVLVLIPRARARLGAQASDPHAPHYDPSATVEESPVHTIELDAYFISKYELTRAQWERATGREPRLAEPKASALVSSPLDAGTALLPISQVNFEDSRRTLATLDLELPTEAQWEHAARGGTSSIFWTGDDADDLRAAANVAAGFVATAPKPGWPGAPENRPTGSGDSRGGHLLVGSLRANAFGLHDTMGNVFEWCRDGFASYAVEPRAGDGLRAGDATGPHPRRGGGYLLDAYFARSACRNPSPPGFVSDILGIRPARPVR